MKIILKDDIKELGQCGDVIEVNIQHKQSYPLIMGLDSLGMLSVFLIIPIL